MSNLILFFVEHQCSLSISDLDCVNHNKSIVMYLAPPTSLHILDISNSSMRMVLPTFGILSLLGGLADLGIGRQFCSKPRFKKNSDKCLAVIVIFFLFLNENSLRKIQGNKLKGGEKYHVYPLSS